MSESTPESTPDINVEGDAVINDAPDGGGIDNAAPAEDAPAEDSGSDDSE